jgi:hypothetical protein
MIKTQRHTNKICGIRLFCDYAIVGRSEEFPLLVAVDERNELSVGSLVCVTGDGVADRQGVVTRVAETSVVVRVSQV